jgi:hypothetical protein
MGVPTTSRLIWPATVPWGTTKIVNNHTYVSAPGTFDAPNADVPSLLTAGAALLALSGPTDPPGQPNLNRPGPPNNVGTLYLDTGLNKLIAWDGNGWRDPGTGQLV